jgi:hypothetical protein
MFAIIDPNLYYFNEAGDIMNINSKTNDAELLFPSRMILTLIVHPSVIIARTPTATT